MTKRAAINRIKDFIKDGDEVEKSREPDGGHQNLRGRSTDDVNISQFDSWVSKILTFLNNKFYKEEITEYISDIQSSASKFNGYKSNVVRNVIAHLEAIIEQISCGDIIPKKWYRSLLRWSEKQTIPTRISLPSIPIVAILTYLLKSDISCSNKMRSLPNQHINGSAEVFNDEYITTSPMAQNDQPTATERRAMSDDTGSLTKPQTKEGER